MKEKESILSLADMSVEVWDQASGQNHVLQVGNQILHSQSKRPAHPAIVVLVDQQTREFELEQNCKPVTLVAPSCK